MTPLTPQDIDHIERATLHAVAPERVDEAQGWLLPTDPGTIGRAKSAVPLWNAAIDADTLNRIEAHYQSADHACVFRLSDADHFADLRQALAARGYLATKPTEVHVAWVNPLAAFASPTGVDLDDAPDAAWGALFMGPGFDPVDGAARVQNLSRATGTAYASMRASGMTLAAGAGAFSHGWLSIHGMRTDANHRGKGLAGQILSAFATVAQSRGIARCFLQVEQGNAPALALYRRAGFERAWSYAYWRRDLRC